EQRQSTARPQRTTDVAESGDEVAEEHRGGTTDRDIERRRLERADLRVGLYEGGVADAFLRRPLARVIDHPRREVDTERGSRRRGTSGVPRRLTGATTDVEHIVGGPDLRGGEERPVIRGDAPVEVIGALGPER